MKLIKYRVRDFRSIDDSGDIETGRVTTLIGTNESGKTNVLLPLWKLKNGPIEPAKDYPRKLYSAARNEKPPRAFIEAHFEPDVALLAKLVELTQASREQLAEIKVARRYDKSYVVSFPRIPTAQTVANSALHAILKGAADEIGAATPMKTEETLAQAIKDALQRAVSLVPAGECSVEKVQAIQQALDVVKADGAPKSSSIVPRFNRAVADLKAVADALNKPHPNGSKPAADVVVAALPNFVYYSSYGNLDSEIYLPHVIQNLARQGLGDKEAAKARTLKVLFQFVGLKPEEILELGKEAAADNNQIALTAEKKTERTILLDSASTRLTESFRTFWKQGNYTFHIRADGHHLRIWVADSLRPQLIELEGRSAGLQWFLSFFLVFLVERDDEHSHAILLLDEPGHTLHPLGQEDLSAFFNGLAESNQLIYTTHSPFLVDADHLDRARKVFVDLQGTSRVTADLGAASDASSRGAGYAVHAALEISVAKTLLIGCSPVVVEGPSDQHYLTGMKTVLVRAGCLKPGRELVFPPAGGARGVKPLASLLFGRDDKLPLVLLDSDQAGQDFAKALRDGIYAGSKNLILQVGDFFDQFPNCETEDLLPTQLMVEVVDRWQRPNTPFADVYKAGSPMVDQIAQWAKAQGLKLEDGWKVELAKHVKARLLSGKDSIDAITLGRWTKLFEDFESKDPTRSA